MTGQRLEAAGRHYLRARTRRSVIFGQDDLADPEWDMLLDLYLDPAPEPRSITSVCDASRLPPTTALRWVKRLGEAQLIARMPDPFDARRSNLSLTTRGEEVVLAWLTILSGGRASTPRARREEGGFPEDTDRVRQGAHARGRDRL